jgi:hypothetical protein
MKDIFFALVEMVKRLIKKVVYIYEETKPKKNTINDSGSDDDEGFEFDKTETVVSDSESDSGSDVEMTDESDA